MVASTCDDAGSVAPTARIVACVGLMMAEKLFIPSMPRLDTAVEPPSYSSGRSLRARMEAAFVSLSGYVCGRSLRARARMEADGAAAKRLNRFLRRMGETMQVLFRYT